MVCDYTEDNLRQIVNESKSFSDVCRQLGIKAKGSNFNTVKKYINLYDIDISHFVGAGWKRDKSTNDIALIDLNDILKDGTSYKPSKLKKRLIDAGLKVDVCEVCGIDKWNGKDITLELHHINGNRYDNRLENLQVLCPNCHSQTDSYKRKDGKIYVNKIPTIRKNVDAGYKKICPICNKSFVADRDIRVFCSRDCYNKSLVVDDRLPIDKDVLKNAIQNKLNISDIAKLFGVSRPTIRKYLERFGLMESIKEQYDFHSKEVVQYTLNGEFVKDWGSIKDAEDYTGISGIGKVAKLQRKSAGGYIWRFKE